MGADRDSAVRKGATQREIHAGAYVIRVPVRLTVGRNRCAGAGMCPVRIATAWPDVPFIEMRVHVDEAGQHNPPAEIDRLQIHGELRSGPRAQRRNS
jgi:hypothetical protein